MCTPIIDGHAVYFLLLPGPGGIVHKLLSGISPLITDISTDKNNQLTDISSHLVHLGEIVKIKKLDNFD